MTCMRETCQNPCIVSNPCIGSQKCVVKDNFSSLRSVACECPEGLIYGGNGECIHGTGENECSRNEDCRISEVCHTGTCINACLVFKCAPYATCQTTVHDVQCTCISGYTGDGKIACDRSKFLVLSQIVCTITYTYVIILNYQFSTSWSCRTCINWLHFEWWLPWSCCMSKFCVY